MHIQTTSVWILQCQSRKAIGSGVGRGYCGEFRGSGVVRHVSTLPSVTIPLVTRQENVDNVQAWDVGAVPDDLYPGDGPPSLQERFCLGPQAQLISVHDLGVPPQCHPEGTQSLPWTVHMDTSNTPNTPII